jgi:hypothetical protein
MGFFFQLQWTLATYGIYIALSVIGQVAVVAIDTLCRIQYHIYNATCMHSYAISLQLISMSNSHTHSNVAFHQFVDK